MYKILIKYISSSGKDNHMWISHGNSTVTKSAGSTIETFTEFQTDNMETLKAELDKLHQIFGLSEVRAINELDVSCDITVNEDNNEDDSNSSPTTPEISDTTLTVMERNTACIGKNISDLIEDDVKVLSDGSVTGTLKHVTDFVGFSSNVSEQNGYYFPFRLSQPGTKMTIKKNGVASAEKTDMVFDPEIILRIDDKDVTFTIDVDGTEVVTLNFKGVNLA